MMKIVVNSLFLSLLLSFSSVYAGGGSAGGGEGSLGIEFSEVKLTLLSDSIISDGVSGNISRGFYEFVVTNKSDQKLEFILQELNTDKVFKKLTLKPGKEKSIRLKISKNGVRYSASNTDQWYQHEVN